MLELTPFSYIQDKKRNIYTVRFADNEKGVYLSKISYRYKKGNYIKQREFKCAENSKNIKWLNKNNIIKTWTPLQITEQSFAKDFIISEIYSEIIKYNANLYLIGSRLLNIENDNSDWDILIKCEVPPLQIFDSLIKNVSKIRKYNQYETIKRAERYSVPYSQYTKMELCKVFSQCCTYIKYQGKDIGLFFIKSFYNSWFKGDTYVESLSNLTLLQEKTDTYSMPRHLQLMQENGDVITIISIDWLIYGIEDVKQNKFNFFNLWQVSTSLFVLDHQIGYVKFN